MTSSSRVLLLLRCAAALAAATSIILVAAQANFDVTRFGAVGDGKTDDSAAVAKATAALLASPVGGTLFFPPGNFLFSGPGVPVDSPYEAAAYIYLNLSTSIDTSLNVLGSGATGSNQTMLIFNSDISGLININTPPGYRTIVRGSLRSFAVYDMSGSLEGAPVVLFNQATEWATEGIVIIAANAGITAAPTVQSLFFHSILMSNVTNGFQFTGGDDIVLAKIVMQVPLNDNTHIGVWVQGATTNFRLSDTVFTNHSVGVFLGGALTTTAKFADISNVEMVNVGTGVWVDDSSTVSISHSAFNGSAVWNVKECIGVTGGQNSGGSHITVSDCLFVGEGTGVVGDYAHVTVTNNLFLDCRFGFSQTTGPSEDGRTPFVLTRNQFNSSLTWAVLVTESMGGFVIEDNLCGQPAGPAPSGFDIATCTSACLIENNPGCTGTNAAES